MRRSLLLIEPPFYRLFKDTYALVKYPLSLAYLATAVKRWTAWDVRVFNADFAPVSEPFNVTWFKGRGFGLYLQNLYDPAATVWRQVRETIGACRASVVGISAKAANFASAVQVARIVRQVSPETLVVVGGPHPTSVGRGVLDCSAIDMAVCGEGEQTLVELLSALESGTPPDRIAGLIVRDAGRSAPIPCRALAKDLDALGFAHALAPGVLQDYPRYPPGAFASVMATRGCPFNCVFCGSKNIWGRTTRFRSPAHVVAEIGQLHDMGVEAVHFDDDTFGVTPAYLRALCQAIRQGCPQARWSCELHVRLATKPNIACMKAAGCNMIQLGMESGNDGILKKMRKGFTVARALAACGIIRDHGIRLQAFFMGGVPWESEKSLTDTLKLIESLDCEKIIYSMFTPYPGTEAFAYCLKKGLIPANYDIARHNHQSPANGFCLHLSPEKLARLSSRIEQVVVSKNEQGRPGAGTASFPVPR